MYSDEESSSAEEGDKYESFGEVVPAWQTEGRSPGDTPWPGHRALKQWRQAGRECHLYAYAPYTRFSLALPSLTRVLYWVSPCRGFLSRVAGKVMGLTHARASSQEVHESQVHDVLVCHFLCI